MRNKTTAALIASLLCVVVVLAGCSTKTVESPESPKPSESAIDRFKATRTGNVAEKAKEYRSNKGEAWEVQLKKIRKRREWVESQVARGNTVWAAKPIKSNLNTNSKYGTLTDLYESDGYTIKTYMKETSTYRIYTSLSTYKGKSSVSTYKVKK